MGDDPNRFASVRAHFESDAAYWDTVYESASDVAGLVYSEREQRALALVDGLGLPRGARVADIGAGAGRVSVALAERGYDVVSVDAAENMLELTKARAERHGVALEVLRGDASALPLPDAGADAVVALGLLPWVGDPAAVVAECRRVLRPGGALIVTADNRWRLVEFLDPSLSPFAAPARRTLSVRLRALRGRPEPAFEVRRHSVRELERLLSDGGLRPVSIATVGYGPVTFMRRPLLDGPLGLRLARRLSVASERRSPLAKLGVHVLALAARPEDGRAAGRDR
jgi:SAM-dependent methyltransferase